MPEPDDQQLLREFAGTDSEAAFAALVARHVNLVYSTALRFSGNPHRAEEITQVVFIILARKAKTLGAKTVLSGWLYQAARLTAANVVKSEIRRQRREQEAYMQSTLNESDAAAWEQIAPLLDDAMGRLGEPDRNAVVLRFFENKTAREVAAALRLTEAAAHKRVNRALDKLRKYFSQRGVTLAAAAIAGAVSAHSVHAAPVGLAKSVSAVALAKGAAASASTLTLINGALKIMAWTKAKTAIIVGTAIVLATGTSVVVVKEIAAPAGTAAERAPVVMEAKWQIGKKYLMRKEDIQTTEVKNAGQTKAVKQAQKFTHDSYFLPVRKLENGGWQLQMEFASLALEVTNGTRKVFAADSAQDPAQDARNPVGARLRKMIGARLEYFTDANGKVEQMNGYQELVARVAGNNPQEQAAFKDLFSEIDLQKFGSLSQDSVPRRVVKLGDRWTMKLKVPNNGGDLNLDIRCFFKNWEQRAERKCMHITFKGSITAEPGSDGSGVRTKVEKGTMSGDAWFDPELGMMVEINEDVDAQLKINQNGQIQTVPLNEKAHGMLVAIEDV